MPTAPKNYIILVGDTLYCMRPRFQLATSCIFSLCRDNLGVLLGWPGICNADYPVENVETMIAKLREKRRM